MLHARVLTILLLEIQSKSHMSPHDTEGKGNGHVTILPSARAEAYTANWDIFQKGFRKMVKLKPGLEGTLRASSRV